MDANVIVIVTLFVLIILYLIRELRQVETRMRGEYEAMFEDWKRAALADEAARRQKEIVLVNIGDRLTPEALIEAIRDGRLTVKEG